MIRAEGATTTAREEAAVQAEAAAAARVQV